MKVFLTYIITIVVFLSCENDKSKKQSNKEHSLKSDIIAVKAQIHAGGRGKGGGVKIAKNKDEAEKHIKNIFGMNLITHQTGEEGKKVETMFRTPELEENKAIHQIWRNFNQVTHKRRRTYRIDIK